MKKKIFLGITLTFIISLIVLILNYKWVIKKSFELAGVKVERVEKVSIGNWIIHKLEYEILPNNIIEVERVIVNFLDINVDAKKLELYKQALNSNIKVSAELIKFNKFRLNRMDCFVHLKQGTKLEVKDIHIPDLGSNNRGVLTLNLATLDDIKLTYKNINITHLIKYFDSSLALSGHINIDANMNGTIHARAYGKNLTLNGFKVDEVISNFLDTRNIGLIDAAAVVALGPIGLLYTSAASLGQTLGGFRGGETMIKQINADVNLKDDIVSFNDVAVATEDNLVIAQGSANIISQAFEEFVVSVLDDKYCPELQQIIKGTFTKPEISKTKAFLDTATAPVASVKSSTFQFVGVEKCRPIYKGVVKHPQLY